MHWLADFGPFEKDPGLMSSWGKIERSSVIFCVDLGELESSIFSAEIQNTENGGMISVSLNENKWWIFKGQFNSMNYLHFSPEKWKCLKFITFLIVSHPTVIQETNTTSFSVSLED